MAKQRLTRAMLTVALRGLLTRPDTRVVKRKLKECGQSTWIKEKAPDGTARVSGITVFIDRRRDGIVRLVIHELLHIYFSDIGERMVYALEEPAILAWEDTVYGHLHKPSNEKQLESWAKAIERRMA